MTDVEERATQSGKELKTAKIRHYVLSTMKQIIQANASFERMVCEEKIRQDISFSR